MAKTLICITSYNRQESLARLLANLMNDSRPGEVDIIVFDDRSDDGTAELLQRVGKLARHTIATTHRGKAGFWHTFQDIFDYIKNAEPYDYYMILPDDVLPCADFVNKAIQAFDESGCICLSPLLTNRSLLPGISRWGNKPIERKPWGYLTHYFDCCGIMRREFFEVLNWHMMEILPSADPYRSSGVGRQITTRLQAANKPMGHVHRTLLTLTEHDSVMNDLERQRHPMYADWQDNVPCVDVHMAALWRGGHVVQTAESLLQQVELATLFVTLNNFTKEQDAETRKQLKLLSQMYGKKVVIRKGKNAKGSNEKLSQLSKSTAPYIAFADDDIVYPDDYLFRLIGGCNARNGAVSLHGSRLTAFPTNGYYAEGARRVFSCTGNVVEDVWVDILGTGCSLMRREWLTDAEWADLYKSAPETSMDDLVLSCLLSHKGINRYVLEHRFNLIRLKPREEGDDYVYERYRNADSEQVAYLNAHYQPYGGVTIEATAAAAQTR